MVKQTELDDFVDLHDRPRIASSIDDKPKNIVCDMCGCSNYKKAGLIRKQQTTIQRYQCKDCNYVFVPNSISQKCRLKIVGHALDLFMDGHTLRNIARKINNNYGTQYDHSTIAKWPANYLRNVKLVTDDTACLLTYGDKWIVDTMLIKVQKQMAIVTVVMDAKTNSVIAFYIANNNRTNKKLCELLREARTIAGTPKMIDSIRYAVDQKTVKTVFNNDVTLRFVQTKLVVFAGKSNILIYNNHTEGMWNSIKYRINRIKEHQNGLDSLIEYAIIYYNYVGVHSMLSNEYGKKMTPAMAGGYFEKFDSFKDILLFSLQHYKQFIFHLDDLVKYVNIRLTDTKISVHLKKNHSDNTEHIDKINTILQDRCGFGWSRSKNCWFKSVNLWYMIKKMQINHKTNVSAKTFETCCNCDRIAISLQEVDKYFGRRHSDGIWINQPNCKKCRSRKKLPQTSSSNHLKHTSVLFDKRIMKLDKFV